MPIEKQRSVNQVQKSNINWITFFSLILFILAGYLAIGPLLGFISVLPLNNFDLAASFKVISSPMAEGNHKVDFMVFQAFSSLGWLILVPVIYYKLILRRNVFHELKFKHPSKKTVLLIFIVVITFMVVDAKIIEWNEDLRFPKFLHGFEQWAKTNEALLKQLTEYLTTFDSFGAFILGFITIAVIPAIGEELLFRGILQNQLSYLLKKPHMAIWFTGFLFSFIHFQFYGFVPRMLLGVLFGYLYYWSGNLIVPIFAHFVNNGFTVIMYYCYQLNIIDIKLDDASHVSWSIVLIALLITTFFLAYLKLLLQQYAAYEQRLEKNIRDSTGIQG